LAARQPPKQELGPGHFPDAKNPKSYFSFSEGVVYCDPLFVIEIATRRHPPSFLLTATGCASFGRREKQGRWETQNSLQKKAPRALKTQDR
jgi:hypothetical protein